MVAFVVDTTRRISSRDHLSARERGRKKERETEGPGMGEREPKEGDRRGAPERARGTLTFTR